MSEEHPDWMRYFQILIKRRPRLIKMKRDHVNDPIYKGDNIRFRRPHDKDLFREMVMANQSFYFTSIVNKRRPRKSYWRENSLYIWPGKTT